YTCLNFFCLLSLLLPSLSPYTTLFRSVAAQPARPRPGRSTVRRRNLRTGLLFISPWIVGVLIFIVYPVAYSIGLSFTRYSGMERSEEHTSELQSRFDLVCRLLLEKK